MPMRGSSLASMPVATYLSCRKALLQAQAAMQHGSDFPPPIAEYLARAASLRSAQADFDAVVAVIREANDPADFFIDSFGSETIQHILNKKPTGYALIYLVLTSWGGLALGVLGPVLSGGSLRFIALDIPSMTPVRLVEEEFREGGQSYVQVVFSRRFPQGMGHRLDWLVQDLLLPLKKWLEDAGVTAMTLIPSGVLAAFPLLALPLEEHNGEQVTLADCFVASVAPGAHVLLTGESLEDQRRGVASLGNPCTTARGLSWGEAEALTLAELGGEPERAFILDDADRAHLLEVLHTATVVDVSCHGYNYWRGTFLGSRPQKNCSLTGTHRREQCLIWR